MMTALGTSRHPLLDHHTQEYRRSAADAAGEGRRAAVLCAPYSLRRRSDEHRLDGRRPCAVCPA